MKTVFNNDQLCHVWANQSQSHGKNANGSFYFDETKIYSYGKHYLAGNILMHKNHKVVIINSYNYSNTTIKQLSSIRSAVSGLYDNIFNLPDTYVLDSMENINHMNNELIGDIQNIFSRRKFYTKSFILERLYDQLVYVNKYFKIINYPQIDLCKDLIDSIEYHIDSCIARNKELNSPENVAKREKQKQLNAEKKNKQKIADFRSGKNVKVDGLIYDLLRIDGELIKTSRGASVGLVDGINMLDLILSGKLEQGYKIGYFSFDNITKIENDSIIKIGCHKILLSEAVNVLKNKAV